ncbi:TolC family protein [Fulvivirga ulvae]|uniref:TolC family protein n=1 Tax=Fulvivirga ulvae TaxID=2904245 RepID=UPI001F366364|nr:TolC family protein [Fulvivirga ulvae]UII31167.1 TolC family protein [Fulvivirga ulvae]
MIKKRFYRSKNGNAQKEKAIKNHSIVKSLREIMILSTCLYVGIVVPALSQSILDDYVAIGKENNLALKQEDFMLSKSIEALREAKGLFMPSVYFNASYTLANGGRTIDIPIGDLLNPVYATLNGLTNSQDFPTDMPNASEQLLPNKFHDTRLEFRLPIFNTDIYYNYKAKSSLISVQQAQRDTYEKELEKEIKTGYYQYLQTLEVLNIYDSTETVLKELVKVNESLVKNNKATSDAVYNAQYELSDLYSKKAEAYRQHQLAKSYFNFLLNRELSDSIYTDPEIILFAKTTDEPESLQEQAIQNREELRQVQYGIEASQYIVKLNKGSKLPNLSVGGAAGFQGFGYDFDSKQDYRLLQFNLSVPLYTGKRNDSKIQQATIEVDRMHAREQELRQQIRVQVADAYRNLQAAQSMVDARAAGAKSAAESFKIIKRKYEESKVILVEYLDARTKFTNSQISLAIAQYNVLIREAELQRVLAL